MASSQGHMTDSPRLHKEATSCWSLSTGWMTFLLGPSGAMTCCNEQATAHTTCHWWLHTAFKHCCIFRLVLAHCQATRRFWLSVICCAASVCASQCIACQVARSPRFAACIMYIDCTLMASNCSAMQSCECNRRLSSHLSRCCYAAPQQWLCGCAPSAEQQKQMYCCGLRSGRSC